MSESENQARDNFQNIKGIGEVTEKALKKAGIRTYQDLAQLSSTELVKLLKGKISDLTLRRIEKDDWTGQARTLMEEQKNSQAENEPPHRETWREVADFFISFGYAIDPQGKERLRTKVHHSQADKLQEWEGIPIDKLVSWMLKQARLHKKISPTGGEKGALAQEKDLFLEDVMKINGENVIQMAFSDVRVQESSPLTNLKSEQSENILRIETQLTLQEESIEQTFERAPYSIEIYLMDMSTGESKLVKAYSGYLSPGQKVYPISQDIGIPETGRYQLLIFARLLPPFIGIAQAQGPLIRVEA